MPTVPKTSATAPAAKQPPSEIELALGVKFDSKAGYVVVSEHEEGRYRTLTDPNSGDPDTSPADMSKVTSTYTMVGRLNDGRAIFQLTGAHPTR